MNRKYKILIIISILLMGIILSIEKIWQNAISYDSFQVDDTARVTSILIIQNSDSLLLSKTNGGWKVNGQRNARKESVASLLWIMKRWEIKSLISDSRTEEYRDIINSKGVRVLVSMGNSKRLLFYFYEYENTVINSLLLMPNDDKVYLVKIPAYNGRIGNWFTTNISVWQDKLLFDISSYEISKVKVIYPKDSVNNYILAVDTNSRVSLYNERGELLYNNPNQIEKYFNYFRNISFTKEMEMATDYDSDDLVPWSSLQIQLMSGLSYEYTVYRISKDENIIDYDNAIIKDEISHRYYLIKYVEIDLLFKELMYFK